MRFTFKSATLFASRNRSNMPSNEALSLAVPGAGHQIRLADLHRLGRHHTILRKGRGELLQNTKAAPRLVEPRTILFDLRLRGFQFLHLVLMADPARLPPK